MAGNYYNFYAATAGTGNPNLTSGDAPDSICPKGWHLPSSTGTGSYTTLVQNYVGREGNSDSANADTPILSSQLGINRSGWYDSSNGKLSNQHSYGRHWSSTAADDNNDYAAYLVFYNTRLYFRINNNRGHGFSLRCLAR